MKCTRCNGRGFLFDMMLNEKPCYVCNGNKEIRNNSSGLYCDGSGYIIDWLGHEVKPCDLKSCDDCKNTKGER